MDPPPWIWTPPAKLSESIILNVLVKIDDTLHYVQVRTKVCFNSNMPSVVFEPFPRYSKTARFNKRQTLFSARVMGRHGTVRVVRGMVTHELRGI